MEVAIAPQGLHLVQPQECTHVSASELLSVFNQYADKIKVLSLDCFDTLLWRKSIEPKDVFFDMQRRPAFMLHGIVALNRVDAEDHARSLMFVKAGHYEVTLNDIYHAGFSSLNQQEIDQLIEEEIKAEIEACYPFPPIVELIKAAHARGLRIIIVSNTYLKEEQLRHLLANVLPMDVLPLIEKIFCSCDYKKSKNSGIFSDVLLQMGESPQSILHLGDNYAADFCGARAHDLRALRFVQFNNKITEYLRLQSMAATITDTSVHHKRSMVSPFRGILANAHHCVDKPESIIGYMSLGPIMYTFANYLCDEIEQLRQSNKNVKVLFLMRDAYLPALACEALAGAPIGKRVRVSRFSATASSFRSKEDIEIYLAGSVELGAFSDICKHFLIPESMAEKLIAEAEAAEEPAAAFVKLILKDECINYICKQSENYWKRLKKYLQREADIKAGDTLVLVDVGYVGRTQRLLAPIMKNDMGIEVTGRYLISLNALEWQKTRKGLIDPSWCDDRAIDAICLGNSLLEELCCSPDKSVVDYDETGAPIFSDYSASDWQSSKTRLIQAECLRFVRDAKYFFEAVGGTLPMTMMRDVALAELARRTFFPMEEEIKYLEEYKHDINFGNDDIFVAVDRAEKELMNLRCQGLWFKGQNTYGLRSAGLELSLALMSQRRHGFATNLDDMSLRRENIIVLFSKGMEILKRMVSAAPTHDGYFSLWFGVDETDKQIAIMLGLNYKALQIEHADLIKKDHFYTERQAKYAQDIRSYFKLNQMIEKEDNFFECQSDAGTLILPIENLSIKGKFILRIIFRPIIKRKNKSEPPLR